MRSPVHAQRDLSPMRDQDLLEHELDGFEREQGTAVVDGLTVRDVDAGDTPGGAGADGIPDPQSLDIGELPVGVDRVAFGDGRPSKTDDPDDFRSNRLKGRSGILTLGDGGGGLAHHRPGTPQLDLGRLVGDPNANQIALRKRGRRRCSTVSSNIAPGFRPNPVPFRQETSGPRPRGHDVIYRIESFRAYGTAGRPRLLSFSMWSSNVPLAGSVTGMPGRSSSDAASCGGKSVARTGTRERTASIVSRWPRCAEKR